MQTIRQGIMDNETVGMSLAEGDTLVREVSIAYGELRQVTNKLSDFQANGIRTIKERVDDIEGEIAFEVKEATDDSGKKIYSNDTKRAAALKEGLKASEFWLTATGQLRAAQETESKLKQDVMKCEHEVKITRYYFSVWQSRMAVIAGLSNEQQEHRHHLIASTNVTIGGNNAEEKE